MMFRIPAAAAVITLALGALVSCTSLSTPKHTMDYTPRDGQVIWFKPDEVNATVRLVAACISASEMATDFHRAARKYADYMRLCYYNVSQDNVDVDAGIRALNFIRKLHRDAEGSDQLWQEAIRLAKLPAGGRLVGKPIPPDYQ